MKIVVALQLLFVSLLAGSPVVRNDLTCQICLDIVTDLGGYTLRNLYNADDIFSTDNFITSETTEEEILAFFNQICEVN